jgi:small subunit ribosomal protein S3
LGQKVHPVSFRLGINRTWDSKWFANKEYSAFVLEDFNIRKFLKKKLLQAGVSKSVKDRD